MMKLKQDIFRKTTPEPIKQLITVIYLKKYNKRIISLSLSRSCNSIVFDYFRSKKKKQELGCARKMIENNFKDCYFVFNYPYFCTK